MSAQVRSLSFQNIDNETENETKLEFRDGVSGPTTAEPTTTTTETPTTTTAEPTTTTEAPTTTTEATTAALPHPPHLF